MTAIDTLGGLSVEAKEGVIDVVIRTLIMDWVNSSDAAKCSIIFIINTLGGYCYVAASYYIGQRTH